tara:strand:+ start:1347 stop:1514 length:168 start_codon:yes stop_codon:yes gene_type:complete
VTRIKKYCTKLLIENKEIVKKAKPEGKSPINIKPAHVGHPVNNPITAPNPAYHLN